MSGFFTHKKLLAPPTKRAAYSDRTAWIMAECSRLAYTLFEEENERKVLIENLRPGGFELVDYFDGEGTQAYLAKNDDFAVLAFRGTQKDFQDILTDLMVRKYQNPDGTRTHRGFERALGYIRDDIEKAVKKLDSELPLYITGHSLGGALATIATLQLAGDDIAACYTFGAPRVGNDEFSRNIKVPIYRVVNSTDIVARVPLILMGYRHVGDVRYLNKSGFLIYSPNSFSTFLWFVVSFILSWRSTYRDHAIMNYCNKLAEFALSRNP